jgi:hypothetical protein
LEDNNELELILFIEEFVDFLFDKQDDDDDEEFAERDEEERERFSDDELVLYVE